MKTMRGSRGLALAIAVLIVPLAAATKCQPVASQAPAVAPAGGGSVYVGIHPPLRAGSWEKVRAHTWQFIGYAALAAALVHAGQHVVLSEQADAGAPAKEVELTIHIADPGNVGYGTVCYGKPENFLLASWKLPDGTKLELNCLGWKRTTQVKFRTTIDCLTRVMSILGPPSDQWDGIFGGRVNIWRFGGGGEMISHLDGTIYSVTMPFHRQSWGDCASGMPL